MRQSTLFSKTRREAPTDETAKNAALLIKAGYVYKEMAGVYAYLPLGIRVLEKIKNIVREEMNGVGGVELLMTSLQKKEIWERTDRWNDEIVDVWFKSELKAGGEVGFGWSHEEPIGEMMRGYIESYKDLPIYVYQFQIKLRNELRAKSGVMRGREFLMKDMYSFSLGEVDHTNFYNETMNAYLRVFERTGIGHDTFVTRASGGAFTEFSHEFQTICEAGEDEIYFSKEKGVAFNKEIYSPEVLVDFGISEDELSIAKTAEVGNIFNFGVQKSKDIGLYFKDKDGESIPVWMGSYGIGITRLMGVVVEKYADEKGIVWPESIAPFQVHLILLNYEDEEVRDWADGMYNALVERGIEVLYDDRQMGTGAKFKDSDLIGIPHRIIMSKKGKNEGKFEVVERISGATLYLNENELFDKFSSTDLE